MRLQRSMRGSYASALIKHHSSGSHPPHTCSRAASETVNKYPAFGVLDTRCRAFREACRAICGGISRVLEGETLSFTQNALNNSQNS